MIVVKCKPHNNKTKLKIHIICLKVLKYAWNLMNTIARKCIPGKPNFQHKTSSTRYTCLLCYKPPNVSRPISWNFSFEKAHSFILKNQNWNITSSASRFYWIQSRFLIENTLKTFPSQNFIYYLSHTYKNFGDVHSISNIFGARLRSHLTEL